MGVGLAGTVGGVVQRWGHCNVGGMRGICGFDSGSQEKSGGRGGYEERAVKKARDTHGGVGGSQTRSPSWGGGWLLPPPAHLSKCLLCTPHFLDLGESVVISAVGGRSNGVAVEL